MSKPKQKRGMSASLLRIILIFVLILNSVGAAFGFSYATSLMKDRAIEVSHKKVDATASNGTIQALKTTQKELEANRDVLQKIGLLRSTSEFPEFRIVDEVRTLAAKNNIQLDSFTYGGTGAAATQGTTNTTTPGQTATPTPATSTSSDTISLSVTPTTSNYLDFLQFTYDIEQHLPKMKIQGISVKAGDSGKGLTIQPLNIEMYVRK
jgi:hypothetical protein